MMFNMIMKLSNGVRNTVKDKSIDREGISNIILKDAGTDMVKTKYIWQRMTINLFRYKWD